MSLFPKLIDVEEPGEPKDPILRAIHKLEKKRVKIRRLKDSLWRVKHERDKFKELIDETIECGGRLVKCAKCKTIFVLHNNDKQPWPYKCWECESKKYGDHGIKNYNC